MRPFASVVLASLLIASVCFSADISSENGKKGADLKCYLPYSVKKDHMVAGCEVSGYHVRYDLAQENGAFMILLPNSAHSLKEASTYFSIQTFPFDGRSLKQILDVDVREILDNNPGTKIVKNLAHKQPSATGGGTYVGTELAYPAQSAAFPSESFYMCDTGSNTYAIMLSLGGRNRKVMLEAYPTFMKWVDVPQMVKDADILDGK
jgi:hypothetical protein